MKRFVEQFAVRAFSLGSKVSSTPYFKLVLLLLVFALCLGTAEASFYGELTGG